MLDVSNLICRGKSCMCASIFFIKQKTAYEIRINDWSSGVCSSDLRIALEMAAEEPEVRLDVHLGDDMAFAMLATVFGNLGDAIEHQHRRQRELRITRTEKLAVRASQQLLVTEAVLSFDQ